MAEPRTAQWLGFGARSIREPVPERTERSGSCYLLPARLKEHAWKAQLLSSCWTPKLQIMLVASPRNHFSSLTSLSGDKLVTIVRANIACA